jgi:hypothetical protein
LSFDQRPIRRFEKIKRAKGSFSQMSPFALFIGGTEAG